jgi:CRISPR-associated protein Cmr3
MNTLLLHPTDILFFRDGRPMSGSLSGHGAAWPLPTVINHAFHAALHRAGDIFEDAHAHRRGRSSHRPAEAERDRKFGSLTTAGPFPVQSDGRWFFPRPLDAGIAGSTAVSLLPLKEGIDRSLSSLPLPLQYPAANTQTASKAKLDAWLSAAAFPKYLEGKDTTTKEEFAHDDTFSDAEHSIGIGIDAATSTQDGERFYSASYLRLREGWQLGVMAQAEDKIGETRETRDLIPLLFSGDGHEIIAGGQQRICRAKLDKANGQLPMPVGKTDGFKQGDNHLVKWVLLTPAIFPKIERGQTKSGEPINPHPGGWLPNWISLDWDAEKEEARENPKNGDVLLKTGDTVRRKEGDRLESREAWRARVQNEPFIPAKLVAAITGKPIPVTGYALPHEAAERVGGAKSTHLAVPSGAVYYFECHDEAAAKALAAALNWHGNDTAPTSIKNRRSTLMGEKGFGLGVCASWTFHDGKRPTSD